jgi:hypothetical protein
MLKGSDKSASFSTEVTYRRTRKKKKTYRRRRWGRRA